MTNEQNNNQYDVTADEILDFLKDNMMTKEDAKNFLTKEDAKNFLTKEDAKNFLTKDDLSQEFNRFKLEMNDLLDDKNADLKGDLVILMRKEDHKVVSLIELLTTKNVITPNEAKSILKMEPFPKLTT